MKPEKDPFICQKHLLSGIEVHTVFDVGAYHGDVSRSYLGLFEHAQVWAFEPYPESFRTLANNFKNEPRVSPVNAALDSAPADRPFYVYSNARASSFSRLSEYSLQSPLDPSKCILETITNIAANTVDAFCKDNDIETIDVLKIDVQGAELEVLKGANHMLQRGMIRLIYTELQYQKLYEQACLYFQVAEFLARQGFRLFGLYDNVTGHDGLLRHCDGIFISESVFNRLKN